MAGNSFLFLEADSHWPRDASGSLSAHFPHGALWFMCHLQLLPWEPCTCFLVLVTLSEFTASGGRCCKGCTGNRCFELLWVEMFSHAACRACMNKLCFPPVNLSCCEDPSCKPRTGKWWSLQRPVLRRQNGSKGQVSVKFCFQDNQKKSISTRLLLKQDFIG